MSIMSLTQVFYYSLHLYGFMLLQRLQAHTKYDVIRSRYWQFFRVEFASVFTSFDPLNMFSAVLFTVQYCTGVLSSHLPYLCSIDHAWWTLVLCMWTGLSSNESLIGIYLPFQKQGQGLNTDMISLVHATEHTLLDKLSFKTAKLRLS